MNVYDFDQTIYDGDSTVDFYFFTLFRNKRMFLHLPSIIFASVLWGLGIIKKQEFKERFYRFLTKIDDVEAELSAFWDKYEYKIKDFYKKQKREDDVIISASPEFLLSPVLKRLGVENLLASRVDKKTGKHTGKNCWGEEKVERFWKKFPKKPEISEFYSDSLSDTPLAKISKQAYIVKGEELIDWNEYKPSKFKIFLSRDFLLFLIIGGINTINGVLFSWLYSLIIKDANLAFVAGYITSLFIAYTLNSFIIFKEKLSGTRFIKFGISYIPNFIIQNIVVFIVYNLLNLDKLIAYILAAVIGVPVTFLAVKLFAFGKK